MICFIKTLRRLFGFTRILAGLLALGALGACASDPYTLNNSTDAPAASQPSQPDALGFTRLATFNVALDPLVPGLKDPQALFSLTAEKADVRVERVVRSTAPNSFILTLRIKDTTLIEDLTRRFLSESQITSFTFINSSAIPPTDAAPEDTP